MSSDYIFGKEELDNIKIENIPDGASWKLNVSENDFVTVDVDVGEETVEYYLSRRQDGYYLGDELAMCKRHIERPIDKIISAIGRGQDVYIEEKKPELKVAVVTLYSDKLGS